jgi:hypothetical protein
MLCIFNLLLKPEELSSSGQQYSETIRKVVHALLKKSPEKRYTSDKLADLVRGGEDHANRPIRGRLLFYDGPIDINM